MKQKKRKIEIDFLYLNLSACTRCKGTDKSLEEAVSEVSRILDIVGAEVKVRKTQVKSEKQARKLGFVSSPTILINGKNIQERLRESLCDSCTDLVGGEDCYCRVWTYRGKQYTAPPPALIVDAILREVYSNRESACCPQKITAVPENIRRFLSARKQTNSSA